MPRLLRRLGDLSVARLQFSEPIAEIVPAQTATRERIAWGAAAVVVLFTLAAFAWSASRPSALPDEVRLDIETPPAVDSLTLRSFALSPDGKFIAFVGGDDRQLMLRTFASGEVRSVAGTEGASYPFWSPDSQSLGFFADSTLKRFDLGSGAVRTIVDSPPVLTLGGSWGADGTVLFAPSAVSAIRRVASTGGESSAVTRLDPNSDHRFPAFLPDGKHFLFYVATADRNHGTFVGQLGTLDATRVIEDVPAAYSPRSGHLLFIREGTLFAQPLDSDTLTVAGNPEPVATDVLDGNTTINLPVSVSRTGAIAYRTGGLITIPRRITWVNRQGQPVGLVGQFDAPSNLALSPDERLLAFSDGGRIEAIDLTSRSAARVSFGGSGSQQRSYPTWLGSSGQVAFTFGNADGIHVADPARASGERLLVDLPGLDEPTDVSTDGRVLLFRNRNPTTNHDIWAMNLDGTSKPFPLVQTPDDERDGQLSPDGRWIAYQSNNSGRYEIYVQPFASGGIRTQVSTKGGAMVRWRADGRELFYIGLDGQMIAVPIQITSSVGLHLGTATGLFKTNIGGAVQANRRPDYVVSRDGQRFLMNEIARPVSAPIRIILNWHPPSARE